MSLKFEIIKYKLTMKIIKEFLEKNLSFKIGDPKVRESGLDKRITSNMRRFILGYSSIVSKFDDHIACVVNPSVKCIKSNIIELSDYKDLSGFLDEKLNSTYIGFPISNPSWILSELDNTYNGLKFISVNLSGFKSINGKFSDVYPVILFQLNNIDSISYICIDAFGQVVKINPFFNENTPDVLAKDQESFLDNLYLDI